MLKVEQSQRAPTWNNPYRDFLAKQAHIGPEDFKDFETWHAHLAEASHAGEKYFDTSSLLAMLKAKCEVETVAMLPLCAIRNEPALKPFETMAPLTTLPCFVARGVSPGKFQWPLLALHCPFD